MLATTASKPRMWKRSRQRWQRSQYSLLSRQIEIFGATSQLVFFFVLGQIMGSKFSSKQK